MTNCAWIRPQFGDNYYCIYIRRVVHGTEIIIFLNAYYLGSRISVYSVKFNSRL